MLKMQKLQKGSFLQLHIDFIHELFDHDQINWPGVRLVDTPQYIHMLNFFSSLSLLNLLYTFFISQSHPAPGAQVPWHPRYLCT